MTTSQNQTVTWTSVPTRTVTAGGVEFAYRELGMNNPGTPVVFLVHLAAVLDNWDPRVVDGFAATHHVKELDPATVVVVLTGYGSIATAVESIKLGAASYLTMPADAEQLAAALSS